MATLRDDEEDILTEEESEDSLRTGGVTKGQRQAAIGDMEEDAGVTPPPIQVQPKIEVAAAEAPTVDDIVARKQKIRQMIDERQAARFEQEHPFMPSGWRPPTTERQYQRTEQEVEGIEREVDMGKRRAEIERRRAEIAAQKERNDKLEQQSLATRQRTRRDEWGNVQPVLDLQGRATYHATPWAPVQDKQSGLPMMERLDEYGQKQRKRPMLKAGDPLDPMLYADLGDGESVPFMHAEEAAKSGDIGLAKQGRVHLIRHNAALRKQRLEPLALSAKMADDQLRDAKVKVGELEQEIEQFNMKAAGITDEAVNATEGGFLGIGATQTGTAKQQQAEREGYQKEMADRMAAVESLKNMVAPNGILNVAQKKAALDLLMEEARAKREDYVDQANHRIAILKEQGIEDYENDPTYKANAEGIAKFDRVLKVNETQWNRMQGVSRPAVQVAPVEGEDPTVVGEMAKNFVSIGKLLLRGLSAEGVYAGTEGISRLLSLGAKTVGATGTAQTLNEYAQTTSFVREQIREGLKVDQEFASTIGGQVAQAIGQVGGTLATNLISPLVPIIGSVGQIYSEGFDDAKATGADDQTAHSTAMKYLPASALDILSNRLMIGKVLKPLVGMTTTEKVRDVLKAFATEGLTEGAQQVWLNQVAKWVEGYDPNRPFDQEVYSSILVGAIAGGGVTMGGMVAKEKLMGGKPPPGVDPGDAAPNPLGKPSGPATTEGGEAETANAPIHNALFGKPEEKAPPPPEATTGVVNPVAPTAAPAGAADVPVTPETPPVPGETTAEVPVAAPTAPASKETGEEPTVVFDLTPDGTQRTDPIAPSKLLEVENLTDEAKQEMLETSHSRITKKSQVYSLLMDCINGKT